LPKTSKARIALRDADPDSANVVELAHRCGFTELDRFAGAYRAIFGEDPSVTPQRDPETRFTGR
jgi:transcriptional regulator GlxA family with amidase domain